MEHSKVQCPLINLKEFEPKKRYFPNDLLPILDLVTKHVVVWNDEIEFFKFVPVDKLHKEFTKKNVTQIYIHDDLYYILDTHWHIVPKNEKSIYIEKFLTSARI